MMNDPFSYIFCYRLYIDKSTTRFTPTIVKGRRHSAPAARAGLSVHTVDIKNESKAVARPKVKESLSEPERKLKSADFFWCTSYTEGILSEKICAFVF